MERKVLGRGLEALIPKQQEDSTRERVQMLNISQIQPSRFQPRQTFTPEKIEELANSIKEKGIIQPILVRQIDGNNFEVIAGERRFRAAKHLGISEIPAIVRRVPDAQVLEMAIIENIQREDLNPLEEAKAYQRLGQEFGLTQDTIAARVGKDKSSISNLLRLLNLPTMIQDYLQKNLITFGHAKALLAFSDQKTQIRFCEDVVSKGLSVRQVEFLSRPKSIKKTKVQEKDHAIKDLERKFEHALGTKVRIFHGKKRGKIEIDYYSLDDLERISKLLSKSF